MGADTRAARVAGLAVALGVGPAMAAGHRGSGRHGGLPGHPDAGLFDVGWPSEAKPTTTQWSSALA